MLEGDLSLSLRLVYGTLPCTLKHLKSKDVVVGVVYSREVISRWVLTASSKGELTSIPQSCVAPRVG